MTSRRSINGLASAWLSERLRCGLVRWDDGRKVIERRPSNGVGNRMWNHVRVSAKSA
jgi:hypothetical protein